MVASIPTVIPEYVGGATPDAVTHGAAAAMGRGETHYVEVAGIAGLREAIRRFLAPLGMMADDTDVLVTAGEQEARFLALQALAGRDVPLAVPAAVHPGVGQALSVRRLAAATIPMDAECQPTLAGVEATLTSGSRILYLETPSRLTGATLPAAFVTALAGLLARHDAHLICDIGLAPFTREAGRDSLAAFAPLRERTVFLGTPWPGFGADAWLIGYLAGPAALMKRIAPLKQVAGICTCAPAQWGVRESEEVYRSEHAARLAPLWDEGDRAAEYAAAPLPGRSATVLALSVPDATAATARLVKRGFAATDGTAFGAPAVVRVTVSGDGAAVAAVRALSEE